MKLSARNILKGKVLAITPGAVNSEIVIELPGGQEIVSVITKHSVENLKLKVGSVAYAVIKASEVLIGVDE
jgi:molybdopterin-binding protein